MVKPLPGSPIGVYYEKLHFHPMRKALYFLGILSDSDIDWLVTIGRRMDVAPGMDLIREGIALDSVFLVIDGSFSVRVAALGDREIARLMSGEVMGEMSFVDSAPPSATVSAIERSGVLAIPRVHLRTRLGEDAGFSSRFYRAMSMFLADRLRTTTASFGTAKANDSLDELLDEGLDNISMAGARFDWIQKRLRAA